MSVGFVVTKYKCFNNFDALGLWKVTLEKCLKKEVKPATVKNYKLQIKNYKPFFTFAAT